jgi:hypothetical protein
MSGTIMMKHHRKWHLYFTSNNSNIPSVLRITFFSGF